jgi:hypothetical protein
MSIRLDSVLDRVIKLNLYLTHFIIGSDSDPDRIFKILIS